MIDCGAAGTVDDAPITDLTPYEFYCVSESGKDSTTVSEGVNGYLKDEQGGSILRTIFESKTGSRITCDFKVSRASSPLNSSAVKLTVGGGSNIEPFILRENSLWTDAGAFIIPDKSCSTDNREKETQLVAVQLLKFADVAHDQRINMTSR